MMLGYKNIRAEDGEDDGDDSDAMFETNSRDAGGMYENKCGDMFSDDGDAGTPHTFRLSTPVSKTTSKPSTGSGNTQPGPITAEDAASRTKTQNSNGVSNPVNGNNNKVNNGGTTPLSSPPTSPTQHSYDSRARTPVIKTPILPYTQPSRLDSMKNRMENTFKFTKQYVSERLGLNSVRTIDSDTDLKIAALRETQAQYQQILRLAKALSLHLHRYIVTQRALGDAFGELSARSGRELGDQFTCNAQTQKLLSKNGELLLKSLNVFVTSMTTLCNTTIEDTLATVKKCDVLRIKYDANRQHVEDLRRRTQDYAAGLKLEETERDFQQYKHKYERTHNDLIIKLKFLDENKTVVCQKHLYLLHKAFTSYISGNRQAVEDVLKQFTLEHSSTAAATAAYAAAVYKTATADSSCSPEQAMENSRTE